MSAGELEPLWTDMLKLKDSVGSTAPPHYLLNHSIVISDKVDDHYYLQDGRLKRGIGALDQEMEDFLGLYLPFCFAGIIAENRGYSYTTAHFAQTLDGKIATHKGHSQWIGNEENLIHAHRMRALSDAIMIGAGTLERDKPQLTVRHVTGSTPARVVIGSGEYDFDSLLNDPGEVILVTSEDCECPPGITRLDVEREELEDIKCMTILEKLYERGIRTIYIEGGSYTSSRFLEDGTLDMVQLHIAPLIVGSGISNFTLPLKDHLDQSIQFKDYHYFHMGREIMFQGEIEHK